MSDTVAPRRTARDSRADPVRAAAVLVTAMVMLPPTLAAAIAAVLVVAALVRRLRTAPAPLAASFG